MDIKVTVEVKGLDKITAALVALVETRLGGQNQASVTLPVQQAPTAQQTYPIATQPATSLQQQAAPLPAQTYPTVPPTAVQPAPVQSLPTAAPVYDVNQLALAATQLMDANRQEEVLNLIHSYGVQALMAIPVEAYNDFAMKLRALGAKI